MSKLPFSINNPLTGLENIPAATITSYDIPDGDPEALYTDSGPDQSIWTDYMINSRYEKDRHTYMIPIASPTGFANVGAAFCQLAKPTLLWIVDWTACRFNEQPDIPSPLLVTGLVTGNGALPDFWILLDEHYEPAMVTLGADGVTPLYRLSGTYVYGCTDPSTVTTNDITFPRPPWMLDALPAGRGMPINKLTGGLITEE